MWHYPSGQVWVTDPHSCTATGAPQQYLGTSLGCTCWQLLPDLKRIADALEKIASKEVKV